MTADVAVIGGGIVGTAIAAFLAEAGAQVVLLERKTIGAGASGRNSGVVQHPSDPVLVELYRESLALYRELEGFALPAAPAGLLYLGLEPAPVEALARRLAMAQPELQPAYLGPGEAARLEPGLAGDVAAVGLAMGFPVPPAAATRAFAARAERAGAEIRLGADARLRREGDRVAGVEVDGERVLAGACVVAAGPWSPALVDPTGRWNPIRPLWGVVATIDLPEPPRHVLEEIWIDTGIAPGGEPSGVEFSLITAAGASSLGSTFFDDEPDPAAIAPDLVEHGARFVPAVAGAPVLGVRACARPLSLDGRPLVGRVPGVEGLWIAAGHGPWGISTGPASARHLATALVTRGPVAAATDPARFSMSG
ncbi:MAG TPA: FAD-dependent oxidoreductase [Candidatus Limnocylindrales bacterium]|nr:FAD-dependent oxidoreductase [Candidatus Limnocylindrales bacterium]